ncbi:VOC family protein [Kineococcus sp. NBC_00420]|uniref:VOC family protein n=1 Tax=Kineococcus sp. NBC_00420 TaxID=2903564 RepID=UPI002E2295B0
MSSPPPPRSAEAIGRLADLVIDCPDARLLAQFWQTVLGRDIDDDEDGWITLGPGPDGHRLSFQQVADYIAPTWPSQHHPQQMHLDVLVEDLPTAHAQVLALGAQARGDVMSPGPKEWRVYADPAGHPFCLVTGV